MRPQCNDGSWNDSSPHGRPTSVHHTANVQQAKKGVAFRFQRRPHPGSSYGASTEGEREGFYISVEKLNLTLVDQSSERFAGVRFRMSVIQKIAPVA